MFPFTGYPFFFPPKKETQTSEIWKMAGSNFVPTKEGEERRVCF
jgi:hypothetical protein